MELPTQMVPPCGALPGILTPTAQVLCEPAVCQVGSAPLLEYNLLKEVCPDHPDDTLPLPIPWCAFLQAYPRLIPNVLRICLSPPLQGTLHTLRAFSRFPASLSPRALKQGPGHNKHSVNACWLNAPIRTVTRYSRRNRHRRPAHLLPPDQVTCVPCLGPAAPLPPASVLPRPTSL